MIRLFGCRPSHPGSPSPAWACLSTGSRVPTAVVALLTALTGPAGSAREIHVAATGQDTAPGTLEQPLRTICAAAQRAEPGDVVTVQGGTYREWVKPARGGTGERRRIVYRAARNQKVVLKGSERITGWTQVGDGIWKVELADSFFGDYNPYALTER